MKRKMLFSVGLVSLAMVIGGAVAISSGAFGALTPQKVYSRDDVPKMSVVEDDTEKQQMYEKLMEEHNQFAAEYYEMLSEQPQYDGLETREAELTFDSQEKAHVKKVQIILDFMKAYGRYETNTPVEEFGAEGYYDFVKACLEAYNDPSFTPTTEERVRMEIELAGAYRAYTDSINGLTEQKIELAEKIAQSVPVYVPNGLNQTSVSEHS